MVSHGHAIYGDLRIRLVSTVPLLCKSRVQRAGLDTCLSGPCIIPFRKAMAETYRIHGLLGGYGCEPSKIAHSIQAPFHVHLPASWRVLPRSRWSLDSLRRLDGMMAAHAKLDASTRAVTPPRMSYAASSSHHHSIQPSRPLRPALPAQGRYQTVMGGKPINTKEPS